MIYFTIGAESMPDNAAGFKICSKQCDQCLFSNNRIVSEEAAKEIIEDCLKKDSWFECHKGTLNGIRLCCRGFWNKHKRDVWPLRLAQLYQDQIEFVDPEKVEENGN